jgi:hypothetical protein
MGTANSGVTGRIVGLGLLAIACAGSPAPLRVASGAEGSNTRLSLIAAPGLRLNARIKPALELPDGRVLRFDSGSLTPDSAYFAAAPTTLLAGRHSRIRGILRASVCDEGALVCRSISLRL